MREAVARLGSVPGVVVLARSHVYETAPVGGVPQPVFFNAAIRVSCTLSPAALLDQLLRIEAALGRVRGEEDVRFGPRLIDLDILWAEGVVLEGARLTIPHPRLQERAFALVPLLEVAPEASDPRTGERYVAPEDPGVRVTPLSL